MLQLFRVFYMTLAIYTMGGCDLSTKAHCECLPKGHCISIHFIRGVLTIQYQPQEGVLKLQKEWARIAKVLKEGYI